jgi:DNA-binding Lrp family transcriptional regulator
MSATPGIDEIDIKILKALARDSREKLTAIAKKTGISSTAVAKRIERLKNDKVITGTHIGLNLEALGLSLIAILVIKAKASNLPSISQAIKKQATGRTDFILTTCQSGIGHFDLLVGIFARDKYVLDELLRFVEGLSGVTKATNYIWLHETASITEEVLFSRGENE